MGWWGRRSDLDRRDEVQSHIRHEADRLEAEGIEPQEALRQARTTFGTSEHLDPVWPATRSDSLGDRLRDLRHAVRRLARAPVSTAVILLSLAVGIGATTSILSLSDQALRRALPVRAPESVVQLEWEGNFVGGGRGFGSLLPHPLYVALEQAPPVFEALAARSPGEVRIVTESGAEAAQAELVTGDYFRLFGIEPRLGRLLGPSDDLIPGGHPVVVLSHAYWTSRFGAAADIVGRGITVNGARMTVVGVAPAGFHGTDWSVVPALWLPMMMNDLVHDWGRLDEPRVRFQHLFARLADGVTPTAAEASLQPWFQSYLRDDMGREGWPSGLAANEVDQYLASRLLVNPGGRGQAARNADLRLPMLILSAATALLLLLACLNVANLSLAKAVAEQRDTSVRTALGASRGRIMGERLMESGLLAATGAVLGLLSAPWIGRWILMYLSTDTTADMALRPEVDAPALAMAAGFAMLVTVLAGVGPAWFAATVPPMGSMKARSRGAAGGLKLRRVLVVGQISLALVFLLGAGLFSGTLRSLRATGPGFETEHLLTFSLAPARDGLDEAESKRALRDVLEGVQRIPGVDAAAVAVWPLLDGGGWGNPVLIEGSRRMETEEALPMNAVSPGFFDALGVPLLKGRDFRADDSTEGPIWDLRAAIVSEGFVRRYLPNEEPLGLRIDFGGNPDRPARMEIVGVVGDYKEQGIRDPRPQVFFPIWARSAAAGTFYVRSRAEETPIVPSLRAAVEAVGPNLAITDLHGLDMQLDELLVFERMLAALATAFAVLGTALAAIGVYGVLSFSAESRTKEIGIRIALGCRPTTAGALIVREALALAGIGIMIAVPVAWSLGALIESQLYGVAARDPGTTLGAAAVVLAACLLAAARPAIRLRSVDPVDALTAD